MKTMTMQVHSPSFGYNERIPDEYTQNHENRSPAIFWDDEPIGTVELALTCIDPGASWVHWTVAGIAPSEVRCVEEELPEGAVEGINSFGEVGYSGPRPPKGDKPHLYVFQVHALNKKLNLSEGFRYEELAKQLAESEIASGTWVGTYSND